MFKVLLCKYIDVVTISTMSHHHHKLKKYE